MAEGRLKSKCGPFRMEGRKKKRIGLWAMFSVLSLSIVITAGCGPLSELEEDPSTGVNGGFEISRNGLPVNWLMYTPNTVTDADFQIVLDKVVYKEGTQSLRFDVKRCAARGGGWHSPGFTNEFFENGKGRFGVGRYRFSCWIRNSGTTYCINAGGVSAKQGDMHTLVETNERSDCWKRLEYEIDVPEGCWLRLELNILQSGTLWIDDIRIVSI